MVVYFMHTVCVHVVNLFFSLQCRAALSHVEFEVVIQWHMEKEELVVFKTCPSNLAIWKSKLPVCMCQAFVMLLHWCNLAGSITCALVYSMTDLSSVKARNVSTGWGWWEIKVVFLWGRSWEERMRADEVWTDINTKTQYLFWQYFSFIPAWKLIDKCFLL